jgi:hypothetical protein
MTLETKKELFGVTHVGEEEVPNTKRMHVGEEEVSLSQLITAVVLLEEEEVPVPQGPTVAVPSEEVEVPAPPVTVLPEEEVSHGPYHDPTGGRGGPSLPPLSWSHRKEGGALSRYRPW